MDSFASGGRRYSTQDDEDDEATQEAMMNRQSVIKFKDVEDGEDELEREVSLDFY